MKFQRTDQIIRHSLLETIVGRCRLREPEGLNNKLADGITEMAQ